VIALVGHGEGVVLPVRAHAAARTTAILGDQAGALKVAVTQAPEKGKANRAIARLLCESLALKRSQVCLVAGETSSRKRFLVRDLTVEQLSARLKTLLER
jgi:uncharacterized protein